MAINIASSLMPSESYYPPTVSDAPRHKIFDIADCENLLIIQVADMDLFL